MKRIGAVIVASVCAVALSEGIARADCASDCPSWANSACRDACGSVSSAVVSAANAVQNGAAGAVGTVVSTAEGTGKVLSKEALAASTNLADFAATLGEAAVSGAKTAITNGYNQIAGQISQLTAQAISDMNACNADPKCKAAFTFIADVYLCYSAINALNPNDTPTNLQIKLVKALVATPTPVVSYVTNNVNQALNKCPAAVTSFLPMVNALRSGVSTGNYAAAVQTVTTPPNGGFAKGGNNGTVSCTTFCTGLWGNNWGTCASGGVGGYIVGKSTAGNVTCDQVVSPAGSSNITCFCQPYAAPPAQPANTFNKGGDNGTQSCANYCTNTGGTWPGGAGACVAADASYNGHGQALKCTDVPSQIYGNFSAGAVTQNCYCQSSGPPAPTSSEWVKTGNNGSATCTIFCAGFQWKDNTGKMRFGTASRAFTTAGKAVDVNAGGANICYCSGSAPAIPSAAPAASGVAVFAKDGNNGDNNCNDYCAGSQFGNGQTGTCVGAFATSTNTGVSCAQAVWPREVCYCQGPVISNIQATYGATAQPQCPGKTGKPGNATTDIAAGCKGQASCTYAVQWQKATSQNGTSSASNDPVPGCPKDYSVTYNCGATAKTASAPAEAGFGSTVKLSCP